MKLDHRTLKEKLPEYFSGGLSEEEKSKMQKHLEECIDCTEDLGLIEKLNTVDVPDPGELFWKTLPVKVSSLSREKRKSRFSFQMLFRPVPAAGIIFLLLLITGTLTNKHFSSSGYYDPLFNDPLSASSIDYSMINDEELLEVSETLTINENNIHILNETYYADSYHKEIASLSSEEVIHLYQTLENQIKNGGVI